MNDETFEIEASAIEASLDEDVEDAAQMDADMSFADIEAEISDPKLEEASSPVQEDERADQKVDIGEMDLRAEIAKLREEIAGVNNKKTEFLCGIKEFAEIFGASALAEIPESVWQSAAEGVPLAAAYALHERKLANQKEVADKVNKKNASMSAGAVKGITESGFYSPAEVRAMSAKEVKKNYNLIIESMKKWN